MELTPKLAMYRDNMRKSSTLAAAILAIAAATPIAAQTGYTYTEVEPGSGDPILFGYAFYKICQIKTFLFSAVYVLGAIAFVIFAVRALFTKFEMKQFIPIIGALFTVAVADLIIAFVAPNAFFCPTVFSNL
jgi:hypothetical protein